jgi:cobalt/nickel transport system permease protein
MMDETFSQGSSFLHKRDPKVKILAATVFVAVIAISNNFTVILSGLVAAVVLLLLAHLAPMAVLKRLAAVNTFTLFLWLTLPLTYGGHDFVRLGSLQLSSEGLLLASIITLKTNTIVLSLIVLLGTSRIANIGHALEGLHLPHRLCFLLLFSYRYIFVIYQEYQKLNRAAVMRCFIPATTIHTYRTVGYLFGMTLVKSWNRASRIHQAMLLRGFNGQLIPLDQQTIARGDYFFLVISLLFSTALTSLHFI